MKCFEWSWGKEGPWFSHVQFFGSVSQNCGSWAKFSPPDWFACHLLHFSGRVEWQRQQRPYGLQNLNYLLTGPLKKKFDNHCFNCWFLWSCRLTEEALLIWDGLSWATLLPSWRPVVWLEWLCCSCVHFRVPMEGKDTWEDFFSWWKRRYKRSNGNFTWPSTKSE